MRGSFVGHGEDNVAPVFYISFLPAWLTGRSLEEAVDLADVAMRARLFNPLGKVIFQTDEALYQRTRGTLFRQKATGREGITNR